MDTQNIDDASTEIPKLSKDEQRAITKEIQEDFATTKQTPGYKRLKGQFQSAEKNQGGPGTKTE